MANPTRRPCDPFLTEVGEYPGVDVEQGPARIDLLPTLDDGAINRIVYDPEAVTARLKTTGHPRATLPLEVHFDAERIHRDPPGDTLKYEWDLDGDGDFDDGTTSPTRRTTYTDGTKTSP